MDITSNFFAIHHHGRLEYYGHESTHTRYRISAMITLVSPNYVEQETTRSDLVIAAMALGFTIGFGFLTTWTALKQTLSISSRYGVEKLNQPYVWMIWLEILVCFVFAILSWLRLVEVIPPRSVLRWTKQFAVERFVDFEYNSVVFFTSIRNYTSYTALLDPS